MAGAFDHVGAILGGFPGAIALADASGTLRWANPAFIAQYLPPGGAPGGQLGDVLPAALMARLAPALAHPGAARLQFAETPGNGALDVTLWSLAADAAAPLRVLQLVPTLEAEPAAVDLPACDSAPALALALARAEAEREAARAETEILRISGEASGVVAWHRFPELGLGEVGAQFSVMLGYPKDFRIDVAALEDLIHPEDRARASADFRAMHDGETQSFCHEFRLRRADGSWAWITSRGRRIDRSDQGLPVLLCGAFTDISDRKDSEAWVMQAFVETQQARDAAAASADLMRTAIECGEVVVWTICPERGEAWMPDEGYRLLGFEPGDFVPDDAGWRALYHPEDITAAIAQMEELVAGRRPTFVSEHRLRHKDGSYHWYRTVARKIDRSDRGAPFVVSGALACIDHIKENERRLAEAALQAERSRARLDNLADNTPGALFEFRRDADGRITLPYFSAKLPEMLGVSRAEIEADGSTVFRHMPPETRAEMFEKMEISRTAGTNLFSRFPVDDPQRGRKWRVVSSQPFFRDGETTVWFGTLLDITDQVEVEERARASARELRATHDRMMTMAEHAPGAIFEFRRNVQGACRFAFFSAALTELLGISRAALDADFKALFTHVPREDIGPAEAAVEKSAREMRRFELQHRVMHPARGQRWLHVSAQPFAGPDGEIVWYGNTIDVTERIESERRATEAAEAARHALDRLSWIAAIAPVGLYEFRRAADGTTSIPYASPFFEELMGIGYGSFERDYTAEHVFAHVHPEDLPDFVSPRGMDQEQAEFWNQRFRVHHPRRGEIWLANSATSKTLEDGAVVWTGALHDVTQDVRREAELRSAHLLAESMRAENERQALHDGLTGLPNRRFYDKVMARRIEEASVGETPDCTLIRIDLDHFKYVNDTLGHEAGDLVLVRVAKVLYETLRGSDFAARIGGDEFSIVLAPGSTREKAGQIVERLQERLAEPLMFEGRQCRFGASFGIARAEDLAQMGAEIQAFADAALYRAKAGGRNRMEFFTPELHTNLLLDRQLAAELQEGLERSEFVPHFQAQIAASGGALTGVETLLRWNHPERGLLAPDAFMHVAEQLRLVPEIDRVMMEKSHLALAGWRARGLHVPKISFNVSAGRMNDPDVVRAARVMADGETRVTFELLESIIVEEESDAFRFHLDAIREAGIEIEIDDFGSGHASIIGLMQIAPQALKIDRRIIAPVACDPRSASLVRAIIEIAETLGIGTVAEGVETAAQAEILRELGCDILQGFLFSRPLSAEDFAQRHGNGWRAQIGPGRQSA